MSTLNHFHRFRDLPRELQLHIWEFYERAQPHRRHYFRNMNIWPGHLYAAADQYTHERVLAIANAGDPDQTQVPDAAVTPNTKIQLPGSGSLDLNWVSRDLVLSAASFVKIQSPRAMASPAYIWANFKNDSFCFARSSASQDFLQYLHGVTGLFPVTPASQSAVTSHWFHQIQSLVLIHSASHQTLGPFDRQILQAHRSLRRLTIVGIPDIFCCREPPLHGPDLRTARLPLPDFLEITGTSFQGICTCGRLRKRVDELGQLQGDLVDLFQTRTDSAPPVNINVEVEVKY